MSCACPDLCWLPKFPRLMFDYEVLLWILQGSERAAEPPVTARDTDLGFLSEFAAAADGPPQESSLQIPWFRLHCEVRGTAQE